MSIAEEVTKVESDLRSTKEKLAAAESTTKEYKKELEKERKKSAKLEKLVKEHERNPLQHQVRNLKAELKEASVNRNVQRLKGRVNRLEEKLAEEQSRRMKSENQPEVQKENEGLKAQIEYLKSENATHHKNRTDADATAAEATKNCKNATKLAQLYEDELTRLDVDHIQLVKASGLKL